MSLLVSSDSLTMDTLHIGIEDNEIVDTLAKVGMIPLCLLHLLPIWNFFQELKAKTKPLDPSQLYITGIRLDIRGAA